MVKLYICLFYFLHFSEFFNEIQPAAQEKFTNALLFQQLQFTITGFPIEIKTKIWYLKIVCGFLSLGNPPNFGKLCRKNWFFFSKEQPSLDQMKLKPPYFLHSKGMWKFLLTLKVCNYVKKIGIFSKSLWFLTNTAQFRF